MLKKMLKLVYALGIRKPYQKIDGLQYLRRLTNSKPLFDEWYFSDKDVEQYQSDSEVLRVARYREIPIFFMCNLVSHIERRIVRDGFFDINILDLMCDLARPDSCVVDIGANIGSYAIPFAKVREDCETHAVEPNPMAMKRLVRNLALNEGIRLKLHQVGLADQADKLPFYAYAEDSSDLGQSSFVTPVSGKNLEPIVVDVVRLDDLLDGFGKLVSLIKIDVQGYEANVLAGATETMRRCRPVILLEHEDANFPDAVSAKQAKNQLQAFFKEANYGVYYITRFDSRLMLPVDWSRALNGNLLALPSQASAD